VEPAKVVVRIVHDVDQFAVVAELAVEQVSHQISPCLRLRLVALALLQEFERDEGRRIFQRRALEASGAELDPESEHRGDVLNVLERRR
jgi:hypothetical protein